MNPAEIVNWFAERFAPTEKRYSTLISNDALFTNKLDGMFAATQGNKPSPTSPLKFNQLRSELSFPRSWGVHYSMVGHTNSMEPVFDYGDAAYQIPYAKWKELTGGQSLEGEIAIYRYGDSRIIHRCIGKDSVGRWIFKGDNNFLRDAPVEDSQVEDVLLAIVFTGDKLVAGQD